MRTRGWAGTAGVVLSLLLVAGCTVVTPSVGTTETPTVDPAAIDVTSDLPVGGWPDLRTVADGTVIATGSFTGSGDTTADTVSGSIEIATEMNRLTVTVRDLDLGPSIGPVEGAILELNARADDSTPGEFRVAHSQLGAGKADVVAATSQVFEIEYGGELVTSDPSWMRTALIWQQADGLPYGRVLATASLAWALPDMRPDLAVLDTGTAPHARGEVIYDSAGDPSGYVVASGDLLDDIAVRFDVEVWDLAWLNPMRGYASAQTGETLNLSRYERGR
ncbi:MAG: LysM domain-containing protein [Cryobacterium sp.]